MQASRGVTGSGRLVAGRWRAWVALALLLVVPLAEAKGGNGGQAASQGGQGNAQPQSPPAEPKRQDPSPKQEPTPQEPAKRQEKTPSPTAQPEEKPRATANESEAPRPPPKKEAPQGYRPPPKDAREADAMANESPRPARHLVEQGRADAALDNDTRAAIADARLFAPPAFDGREVNGSFVGGVLDDALGMKDFRVGGNRFFREARPDRADNATFRAAAGSAVIAASGDVLVETHNAPSGLLAYRAAGGRPFNVSFSPEEGYRVTREDGLVVLEKDGWRGVLVGNATLGANGTLDARIDAARPAFFMAAPPGGLEADTRLDIARAVAHGKVFAEVSLVQRGGAVSQDVASFEDPDAFQVNVTNVSTDGITLHVEGNGKGKAVVFTVDRTTLTTPLDALNVSLDDAALARCASFAELENASGERGCYVLHANDTVVRLALMPAHFSPHVFTISTIHAANVAQLAALPQPTPSASPTTSPSSDTILPASAPAKESPGVGVALAVAALALALVTRRR